MKKEILSSDVFQQTKTNNYLQNNTASFFRTSDEFGIFHNMKGKLPLRIGTDIFKSSEHLYQSARFPHRPDIQEIINNIPSPVAMKRMLREKYSNDMWSDFDKHKVEIMFWCLKVKLIQHWIDITKVFDKLEKIRHSDKMPLVEVSYKDDFWGAKPNWSFPKSYIGKNILGKMWDNLYLSYTNNGNGEFECLHPPNVEMLKLFGKKINTIYDK